MVLIRSSYWFCLCHIHIQYSIFWYAFPNNHFLFYYHKQANTTSLSKDIIYLCSDLPTDLCGHIFFHLVLRRDRYNNDFVRLGSRGHCNTEEKCRCE